MFDPFSAITGLIGTGVNASNQSMANAIAMENLRWQKQAAQKQERMSQAARSDVYGNKQRYDPGSNEWDILLTPIQQAIIGAQEREQQRSLTEDASRNRDKRRNAFRRGLQAKGEYEKALGGYTYDQPQAEGAVADKLTQLLSFVAEDKARGKMRDVSTTALRSGRGAMLPSLIRAVNEEAGGSLGETLLKARAGAQAEVGQQQQAKQSKYMPALQYFAQLMDAGGDAPVNFTSLPQEKSAEQAGAMQLMLNALLGGAGNVNSAALGAAKQAGQPLDISGLKGLSGMGGMFGSSGGGQQAAIIDRTNKRDYGVFN